MLIISKRCTPGLLLVLFYFVTLKAQTPTNLEFLGSIADSLLKPVSVHLDSSVEALYLTKLDSGSKLNWFFEQQIIENYGTPARDIFLQDHIRSSDTVFPIVVEFKPLLAQIVYRENGSQKKVSRIAELILFLRLTHYPSRKIIWSGELNGSKKDVISRDQIPAVENSEVSFSVGQWRNKKNRIKLIQPLIISGAAGIVVYLFYSLRSR